MKDSIGIFTSPEADGDILLCTMIFTSHVQATNVIKDIGENIKNLTGGTMNRYTTLLENSLEEAMTKFKKKIESEGFDGAVSVRISHPKIADGAAEIIVYGTAFKYK